MSNKTKLELSWIGKENRPRLEPRILLEDPEKSYHAQHRVTDHDLFDNRLIFGDNLLALKALEQEYAGKIKCIYIDPPYNTGSAFEHYDDGVEHSLWLSLMRDRLELLRGLLRDNGSIWISIDDHEMPYLRVLMDEVFGRQNFVAQCIWEKVYSPKSSAKFLSENHDPSVFHFNLPVPAKESSTQSVGFVAIVRILSTRPSGFGVTKRSSTFGSNSLRCCFAAWLCPTS